jgi:hypothetical protein
VKLHRIHASAQSTRFQIDELHTTWRGEGGKLSLATKIDIAHRMAVCWNVAEGIPTEVLEGGILRELTQAVLDGDLARAQAALSKLHAGTDTTHGRLHDCPSCLKRGAPEDTGPEGDE